MLTLRQAVRRAPATGSPLPMPWGNLRRRGVAFKRGELVMLAARPAAGKSAFALATATLMRVPTLYLCPDTSARSMLIRLGAMSTSRPTWEVEEEYEADPASVHLAVRTHCPDLWWGFDVESLSDIDDELAAWAEVFGQPPSLLILDNLIDITSVDGAGDEWATSRQTLRELKLIARESGACVLVLHHVGEGGATKKDGAPASRDILGRDNRLASTVLTMAMDDGNVAAVAVVKNRDGGKSDPNADDPVSFRFDPPTMRFTEGWG